MTSLNLSTPPGTRNRQSAARLIARCAAMLNADPETLALIATTDEARILLARSDIALDHDRTALGAAALNTAPENPPVLYRLGPPDAPAALCLCASPDQAGKLKDMAAPIAPLILQKAEAALAPAALQQTETENAARDRLLSAQIPALCAQTGATVDKEGDSLVLRAADPDALSRKLDAIGLTLHRDGERFIAFLPDLDGLAALAAHLGTDRPRTASIRRTTKETDIALSVDLDGEGAAISTGVHFFDHMLDQIARHAGIRLDITCEGDVEVDAHHTIEDVCLALGDGLRQALGDKRGIGRYGFALPMDEARASVWIDLSGRPYFRFDGAIPGERVGDYPAEMCAHAFRSISETLKAAIHVAVEGENAHHMIEACYKAFARALRQAVRIEDAAIPSTKGAL